MERKTRMNISLSMGLPKAKSAASKVPKVLSDKSSSKMPSIDNSMRMAPKSKDLPQVDIRGMETSGKESSMKHKKIKTKSGAYRKSVEKMMGK